MGTKTRNAVQCMFSGDRGWNLFVCHGIRACALGRGGWGERLLSLVLVSDMSGQLSFVVECWPVIRTMRTSKLVVFLLVFLQVCKCLEWLVVTLRTLAKLW